MNGFRTLTRPVDAVRDNKDLRLTLEVPSVLESVNVRSESKNVEHEYFYAVHGADDATRQGCLDRAYTLGREF
jgi:hypothetical protein